jgi:hypothetical protein
MPTTDTVYDWKNDILPVLEDMYGTLQDLRPALMPLYDTVDALRLQHQMEWSFKHYPITKEWYDGYVTEENKPTAPWKWLAFMERAAAKATGNVSLLGRTDIDSLPEYVDVLAASCLGYENASDGQKEAMAKYPSIWDFNQFLRDYFSDVEDTSEPAVMDFAAMRELAETERYTYELGDAKPYEWTLPVIAFMEETWGPGPIYVKLGRV